MLKDQINKLQQENNQLKRNLDISQKSITEYKSKMQKLNDELNKKVKELNDKKKELNDIKNNIDSKNNLKRYVDFNNIVVINFISGDSKISNIGIKCLKTDTFAEVEEKLYQIYNEFRESNNTFLVGGKVVLRFKTIEQNNIKDGSIVQLQNI